MTLNLCIQFFLYILSIKRNKIHNHNGYQKQSYDYPRPGRQGVLLRLNRNDFRLDSVRLSLRFGDSHSFVEVLVIVGKREGMAAGRDVFESGDAIGISNGSLGIGMDGYRQIR